ncbi:hypothetical protein ABTK47_19565, partial [Acinetobacter baumannii]
SQEWNQPRFARFHAAAGVKPTVESVAAVSRQRRVPNGGNHDRRFDKDATRWKSFARSEGLLKKGLNTGMAKSPA